MSDILLLAGNLTLSKMSRAKATVLSIILLRSSLQYFGLSRVHRQAK